MEQLAALRHRGRKRVKDQLCRHRLHHDSGGFQLHAGWLGGAGRRMCWRRMITRSCIGVVGMMRLASAMRQLLVRLFLLYLPMMLMILAPRKLIALPTLCQLVIEWFWLTVNLLLQSADS